MTQPNAKKSVWIHHTIAGFAAGMFLLITAPVWSADAAVRVADGAKPAELSVAPLDHIAYPDDRPAWLSDKPSMGKSDCKIVVVSSPSDTIEESLEDLSWMQRAAIATYVASMVGAGGEFDFYAPSDEELERDIVTRRYTGELTQGDAKKFESAVELRFTQSKQAEIRAAWNNIEVGDRLKSLGGLTSLGLVFLMCSSGLIGIVGRRFAK